MPLIFFTLSNGGQYEADAVEGQTLLHAAQDAGIDGFLAECGGSSTCGTCHCYIDPAQWALVVPPGDAELEMLDFVAAERRKTSRLACQVRLTAQHHGLRIELPSRQI
jgi:ferredoxin, 2Fe-2S